MTTKTGKSIAIDYVVQVLKSAARSGVSIPELLVQVGIERECLEDSAARVDRGTFLRLLLTVMEQTGDEFVGFGQGRRSKPGTFSMMAHAVINCANLEEAVRRGMDFYDLFDLGVETSLEKDGDLVFLTVEMPKNIDFRDIIIEAVFLLTLRFMGWLVGRPIPVHLVVFDFPANGEDSERVFNCPIEYAQTANCITFSSDVLTLPLVQNELSLSHFLRNSLGQLLTGEVYQSGLPAQIRTLITNEYHQRVPDFAEVCGKLNMSPQTLRRRLKDANTSYQAIKDDIRKEASVYYLSKPDLSIEEIALLMGFSEASSFHRAFKKWTNKTPAEYRRDHLEQH